MFQLEQIRIHHVREALWREGAGGASVMVGSGFSRNSDYREPGGRPPPNWSELSSTMQTRLSVVGDRKDGRCTENRVSSPLDTAQRYCDEFGQAELDRFLREQIRDEDLEPSELHHRLLALPWVDIFTTNWDTLLERTQQKTISPKYEIVRAAVELPLASRPRIIKLHGSLPAYFPLIATTGDYEDYPSKFAPFVNTARQALMESVFLLLGFSGDDPNFKAWLGWVRKELDSSAPKIYLAGWLNLDKSSVDNLCKLGVAPIDLANHPNGELWLQQNMEHYLATDWLLKTLEFGQSYPQEEWPKALESPGSTVDPLLMPVDHSPWCAPLVPPKLPSEQVEIDKETIKKIVTCWRHNRALYPGWLVLPEQLRGELRSLTNSTIAGDLFDTPKEDRIVQNLSRFELSARLQIINEVIWRREIRLEPIGNELVFEATNTLRELLGASEGTIQREFDSDTVVEIALALATQARLKLDYKEFDDALEWASDLAQNNMTARHRITYERCLWELYQSNFDSLAEILENWSVESGDPYWVVRKSSLLLESGHTSEQVLPALQSAITSLRGSKTYSQDISLLSREAWAAYLAKSIAQRPQERAHSSSPHLARARDLIRFNCDPQSEIRALTIAIQWKGSSEKGPGFELGEGSRPRRMIEFEQIGLTEDDYRVLTAYRIVRLADLVGLPRQSDSQPYFQSMIRHACQELHRDGQFELSLRLLLLVATSDTDEIIRIVLSRPNLATLPQSVIESISDVCEKIIDKCVDVVPHSARQSWRLVAQRARIAMEILARLSLRFNSDRSSKTVRRALAIYENPKFYEDILFREQIRHLLKWSWEAVPDSVKPDLTLELLKSSIPGVDGYTPNTYAFFEPGTLVDGDDDAIPERNDDNEPAWSSTVAHLIHGLSFDEQAQWRSMVRIVQIALAGRLSPDEEKKLANAIWTPDKECCDLPIAHRVIKNWVYFLLPEPEPGYAEEWFRSKWMTDGVRSEEGDLSLDYAFWQIAVAITNSQTYPFSFELSIEDLALVENLLHRWAKTTLPSVSFSPFEHDRIDQIQKGITGAAHLLLHVKLSAEIAGAMYKKFQHLIERGIPAMPLIVGLLNSPISSQFDFHTELRKGLSSSIPSSVSNSALAIKFWLYSVDHCDIPRPPTDLIREIGVIVATRRADALNPALEVAHWVFEHGESADRQVLQQLSIEGLTYLLRETDYGQEWSKEADIPLLRWRCVSLARAMKECGINEAAVENWLEAARIDPLPEVRHKVSNIVIKQYDDE